MYPILNNNFNASSKFNLSAVSKSVYKNSFFVFVCNNFCKQTALSIYFFGVCNIHSVT